MALTQSLTPSTPAHKPAPPPTHVCAAQELYRKIGWPLYRIYGHAFDAMKTMVADDGAAIFQRLEEENKGPLEVLTPEVGGAGCVCGCRWGKEGVEQ